MQKEMEKWEKEDGVKFLKKVGIKSGQIILDFGSRVGHYSIPAAIIVGNNGIVYAIDKDKAALNELEQKAAKLGLSNIKVVKNSGETKIDLENNSIDMALLYDVLHYLSIDKRKKLYKQIHRILKNDGLLSIYPKHIIGDYPLDEFKDITLNDIMDEIQKVNYLFEKKYCGIISHDEDLNHGCIINFKK